MNVMQRYTLETLRLNKKRTIVTIIGVMLSTAMITAVALFVGSFISLLQRGTIADSGNWHALLRDVPVKQIAQLQKEQEIDKLTLSQDRGFTLLTDLKNPAKPYLFFREYNESGFAQMSVRVTEGRLPQKPGEIVVSETVKVLMEEPFKVGDTVTFSMGQRVGLDGSPISQEYAYRYQTDAKTGEILTDEKTGQPIPGEAFKQVGTETFTIVGYIARPSFEGSWSASLGVVGYLDESTLQEGDKVSVYYTAASVNRGIFASAPKLAEKVGANPQVSFNSELLRYYGAVEGDNLYGFLIGFMAVILFIILAASVSMIYNAFAISVAERSRQLGLLASAGATRGQKRASVYFEGFLIGAAGIPLGLLAGIGGIGVTLIAIRPLLDSFINVAEGVNLDLVIWPWTLGVAVLFSAVTIAISVHKPARRASRIMPIDAIRQTDSVRMTRRSLRVPRFIGKLFGFEAEIALKNLKRSRKKYRATVVSLVISIVLFLTVSTYAGITIRLSDAAAYGLNFDIGLTYRNLSQIQRLSVDQELDNLEHAKSVTHTAQLSGEFSVAEKQLTELARQILKPSENGSYVLSADIIRLDEKSFSAYAKEVGVNAEDYKGEGQNPRVILINEARGSGASGRVSGSAFNMKPGETLAFYPESLSQEASTTLEIGAMTDKRPVGTLFQAFNYITLVVSEDGFSQLTGDSADKQVTYVTYMTTDNDQALEQQIVEVCKKIPQAGYYIYNVQSQSKAEQNLMLFMGVFVYGFIILISLICLANIFNTMSTNIALRRKEFAMLRSVGMTPEGFNRMMRFESIFYGLKSLLYGLPLSLLVAFGLHSLQQDVLMSEFYVPLKSYGFVVLIIFIIVFTTILYASRKIKRENIIEALREENI